jgi:hypothetical protein
MPANMPFRLEKGPLGLRMDYMARVQAIREAALDRLQTQSPWSVGSSLEVNGITISLFQDKRQEFADHLDAISGGMTIQRDNQTISLGAAYLVDQELLRPFNRDSTGNRDEFVNFWVSKDNTTETAVSEALISALQQSNDLDVWWECTLPSNSDPGVEVLTDGSQVTRLMFRTDRSPIVAQTAGMEPHGPNP